MSPVALQGLRLLAATATTLALASPARAFLGVADTSLVTVVANPAEAANWAAELDRLNLQLAAAQGTLQTAAEMKAYAGNPAAAAAAMAGLSEVSGGVARLASAAQTDADLQAAWQALGAPARQAAAAELLTRAGAGSSMEVFGQSTARDPSLYTGLAGQSSSTAALRSQVADEQRTRSAVASELAAAWTQFRSASTESAKQALLTEISQLHSQDEVLDARRRALLDDLALADRAERTDARVRSRASDEQGLAESAQLSADAAARAQAADAQRWVTLAKAPVAAARADYSGLRLWTTADTAGGSP